MLPEGFLDEINALPGIDTAALAAAMSGTPEVSFKINRRKCADAADAGYPCAERVRWCPSGFYLAKRPQFTLNPLLHAGVFYVQEASSMIHEAIVAELFRKYNLPQKGIVLDLCAAPGGKTTSMINALPNGYTVVANEVMPQRAKILRENLLKWGYPDILATCSQTSVYAEAGEAFDIVAVDAPCSGEGMMRKDETAAAQWSPRLVAQCAALQREILDNAVAALRPGGFLIYSTCTFNRTENEENAEWLAGRHGLEPIDMEFPAEWGIATGIGCDMPVMRFMPHVTRGEGLFAAVLRKPGEPHPQSDRKALAFLRKKARVILDGIPTVSLKGKIEIPASEWALSTAFPSGRYPVAELDEATALSYLRHEAIRLDADAPRGFTVVTCKGHRLGFVKNIGNPANNIYPAEWRIRNL